VAYKRLGHCLVADARQPAASEGRHGAGRRGLPAARPASSEYADLVGALRIVKENCALKARSCAISLSGHLGLHAQPRMLGARVEPAATPGMVRYAAEVFMASRLRQPRPQRHRDLLRCGSCGHRQPSRPTPSFTRRADQPAASQQQAAALIWAAQSTMAIKIPIIASETTITSRSIVSHWGIRFASCWVIV
jgi:hypothetical protein